jgi:diacylglycerol O-acyltransferase / wax synthase
MSLSPLDATFLSLESPKDHLNIGLVGVFDPSTAPDGWSYERGRELLASRLHRMPVLRHRLAHVPFGLNRPLWADDEHFDLDAHLHRAALPAPGSVRELATLAADVISRPLDLDRPLWELWTVEGLEGGKVAYVLKSHHAALDGLALAELGLHLTDPEPTAVDVPEADDTWEPAPAPSLLHRSIHAARGVLHQPVAAARVTAATARSAGRAVRPTTDPPTPVLRAPRTPFNGCISPRRTTAFSSLALDSLRSVQQATDTTMNDVVLATCAGALHRMLADEDEVPDRPLVALVPRSVRGTDDPGDGGNRLVPMLVPVPAHLAEPLERLEAASAAAGAAKRRAEDGERSPLLRLSELAVPALARPISRFYADRRLADHHPPLINLTISNVPGPPVPLYSGGARLEATFPLGPVYEGSGLNITVTSYLDALQVGVVACPDRVPDPWGLLHHLEDALDELVKAAT